MADKIRIDIFRKKTAEEFFQAFAEPDSKLETGSLAAVTAAASAALICRAAALTAREQGATERLDYLCRNAGIVKDYMVHLIDEDVKSRGPLKKAMMDGDARAIEAARQPAVSISAEIINMMIKAQELNVELAEFCPKAAQHYLAESAELAMAAAKAARIYIVDMSTYSTDDTYRYVLRRENEMQLEQLEILAKAVSEKTAQ